MEAVVFVGIQASGKTSFYLARFFRTHLRISLDLLRTRHREALLLRACLEAKQPFVVDNTNPTAAERARYLLPAKEARFQTVGYYFPPALETCLERNAARPAPERVPPRGVVGALRRRAGRGRRLFGRPVAGERLTGGGQPRQARRKTPG